MTPLLQPVLTRLQTWVAETQSGTQWSFALPARESSNKATEVQVVTYLLEVLRVPVARSEQPVPLQMGLRFLVCTWASDLAAANETLLRLAFSAMEQPNWELESEPMPVTGWQALGIALRPSFMLRVPLRVERPKPAFKRVLATKLEGTPLTSFQGVVLGPSDIPLAGAKVEIPSLRRWTETDQHGGFVLRGIALSPAERLLVRARGKKMEVAPDVPPDSTQPFTIRFTSLED
jgi:hypothetical protein